MIDPGYVQTMARYNSWQNRQLTAVLNDVPVDVLREERGAFFGSIMGTLNHLLWGDTIWMNRFEPRVAPPSVPAADHKDFTPTFSVWSAERFRLDGAIRMWADTVRALDLAGELHWHSAMLKRDLQHDRAVCVTHMFNHQTHHRGQVHAMMTAAGLIAPVSDIIFMPEDA